MPVLIALFVQAAVSPSGSHRSSRQPIVCQAPPGKYQIEPIPTAPKDVVSGRIRILNEYPDWNWAPAAGIVFKLVGAESYVGGQVYIDPDYPGALSVGLRKPNSDTPIVLARLSKSAPAEVSVQVKDGLLTVSTPKKHKSITLAEKVEPAVLMCSSGKFKFEI